MIGMFFALILFLITSAMIHVDGFSSADAEGLILIHEETGLQIKDVLFAGVVNGKNIWKNNYKKTLCGCIDSLKEKGIETVIGTSCSLLHVPYTLKMSLNCLRSMLSILHFAEEKLIELAELKALSECDY